MKIRNGFVSNSSSSSFVISVDDFPSVRSLATYMINKKIQEDLYTAEDYKYYGESADDIKEYIEYDKKLIKRLKNVDENSPVSFPSCNYDTYIKRIGDYYLVSTCNNTDWDLHEYDVAMSDELRNELVKLCEYYENIGRNEIVSEINNVLEYHYDFSHFDNDYYALDKEVIGVEGSYNERCSKCDNYLWNTKKYGLICLKCNPYYKRKDKLDKINLNN